LPQWVGEALSGMKYAGTLLTDAIEQVTLYSPA
jgi:hypothetical protein